MIAVKPQEVAKQIPAGALERLIGAARMTQNAVVTLWQKLHGQRIFSI
jgi:hypothetical protein